MNNLTMGFSLLLVLLVVCLSPAGVAACPQDCRCSTFKSRVGSFRNVHCKKELLRVPRVHVGSEIVGLQITAHRIPVLSDVDEQVANLTQIKELALSSNEITKIEKYSLRGFPSLEVLDLSKNSIRNIPSELFETIPSLKRLYLNNNPELTLPENGFGTKNLKDLQLRNCHLKEIPLEFFDTMPNILSLDLQGNQLTHIGSNIIRNMQKMKAINLEDNNLTAFLPEIVHALRNDNISVALHGNPFQCDCNFKYGHKAYQISNVLLSREFTTGDDQELKCEIPEKSDGVDQDQYLDGLKCDEEDDSSDSRNHAWEEEDWDDYIKEVYEYKWFANYTAQWIVLAIVVITLSVIIIVAIVKKRMCASNGEGSQGLNLSQLR